MFKTKIHNHPRNKHITFDSDQHRYFYKGDEFTGITHLLGKYTKPFEKQKVAKGYAYKHNMTVEQVLSLWEQDRDYGNNVHDSIENLIKTGEFNDDYSTELDNVVRLLDEYKLKPIAAEFVVYDESIRTASMIDIVCEKGKEIVIVDTKTMKNPIRMAAYKGQKMVYPVNSLADTAYMKYCLQVGFYKKWLEEKYKLPVSNQNYILHVHMEESKMIPVISLNEEIEKITQEIGHETT